MVCKGCASRKARIRKWFRKLIGAASYELVRIGFTRLDQHQSDEFARVDEFAKNLDEYTAKWLEELDEKVQFLRGDMASRLSTIRALTKDVKDMVRAQDERISDMENEIQDLTASIKSIEFPTFQPITHDFTDPEKDA